MREFDRRVKKSLEVDQVEYVAETKIDGVAVSLRFEDGKFVQGATRGDGRRGDDITNNLKTIKTIPMRFVEEVRDLMDIEVRGEVYMPVQEFDELNKTREESGLTAFAIRETQQLDP